MQFHLEPPEPTAAQGVDSWTHRNVVIKSEFGVACAVFHPGQGDQTCIFDTDPKRVKQIKPASASNGDQGTETDIQGRRTMMDSSSCLASLSSPSFPAFSVLSILSLLFVLVLVLVLVLGLALVLVYRLSHLLAFGSAWHQVGSRSAPRAALRAL